MTHGMRPPFVRVHKKRGETPNAFAASRGRKANGWELSISGCMAVSPLVEPATGAGSYPSGPGNRIWQQNEMHLAAKPCAVWPNEVYFFFFWQPSGNRWQPLATGFNAPVGRVLRGGPGLLWLRVAAPSTSEFCTRFGA